MINFLGCSSSLSSCSLRSSHHFLFPFVVLLLIAVALVSGSNEDFGPEKGRVTRSVEGHGKGLTHTLVAKFGKRPEEMYSFGIGKRSISDEEMSSFLEEERSKMEGSEDLDPYSDDLLSVKRSIGSPKYAFGLGKRYPPLKRFTDATDGDSFLLGSDKKHDPYAFGLGKRGQQSYAFGLGRKRDPYAFGLGKRNPYAFGLGKRNPYAFGLGKRDPYGFGLGKRSGQ